MLINKNNMIRISPAVKHWAVIAAYAAAFSLVFAQNMNPPVINSIITASAFGGYAGAAAPGSYVEIYGSNLAGTTRLWSDADFSGASAPTALDMVSVTVNGAKAYISYVSPTQVNVEIPDGIDNGPASVILTYAGRASAPATLTISAQKPGLLAPASFNVAGKQYLAAVHSATGAFVSGGNITGVAPAPATSGETLILYGTGFGPVIGTAVAGQIANGLTKLATPFTVLMGNSTATVQYAGLAPGLVGVYQFNVVVPQGLMGNEVTVQTSLNGTPNTLQTLYLAIAGPARGPAPPTNLISTAGNGSVTIAFTAPTGNGGPITNYTATCTGGGSAVTASATASPINVIGLTNGTTYTCTVTATSAAGTSGPSASVTVTPSATSSGFSLTSAAGANGATLPADYTCDGMGATVPLSWANAPAGTKEFALLMTTLPGDGTTKWNWVLYGIPGVNNGLLKDSFLVGTMGLGSDGPGQVYNPPCSQGPGLKLYTYTLYALSAPPVFSVPANLVNGQMVTDAIAGITLGSAVLNLSATRTGSTGSSAACNTIRNSTRASKSGQASVSCDSTYAYVGSNGITTQPMMNGITSTNLQFPIPTNFNGANAWKIPLAPAIAATPTNVVDGPLGVAINGVPIFNPCTQGGCVTGGDTKALGQLDTCNGHAGRADDYHYHAAPTCMMADQPPNYWDTHPLGWALDGFAIFGFNDADGAVAARDSICGGNTKPVQNSPQGYSYHVTNASPYVTNCLVGAPSPDLPNQASKYRPLRQPPVTPFNVSGMTMATDAEGYQVVQFTSAIRFTTNETGMDSYANAPGTYKIRYKQVTGDALTALLVGRYASSTTCWNFEFFGPGGGASQPAIAYCK